MNTGKPVGTGPFKLRVGSVTFDRFDRFEGYWQKGKLISIASSGFTSDPMTAFFIAGEADDHCAFTQAAELKKAASMRSWAYNYITRSSAIAGIRTLLFEDQGAAGRCAIDSKAINEPSFSAGRGDEPIFPKGCQQ
jgi:hypothetical protein